MLKLFNSPDNGVPWRYLLNLQELLEGCVKILPAQVFKFGKVTFLVIRYTILNDK